MAQAHPACAGVRVDGGNVLIMADSLAVHCGVPAGMPPQTPRVLFLNRRLRFPGRQHTVLLPPHTSRTKAKKTRRLICLALVALTPAWSGCDPSGNRPPETRNSESVDYPSVGAIDDDAHQETAAPIPKSEGTVRFATFNLALNRGTAGALVEELAGDSPAASRLANVIQRVRPDVLLLNELDRDAAEESLRLFHDRYLAVSQSGQPPLEYPHRFSAAVNTGVPTELDLDQDGKTGGAGDCFGYGQFPGQYGMAVLSRFPIRPRNVRTFQKFLWQDMPGALLPEIDGEPFYEEAITAAFRLSSKSHWDVPIETPHGVFISWCRIRRRRYSTVPRTAMVAAITMRFASGRTTCHAILKRALTFTTTRATAAGLPSTRLL